MTQETAKKALGILLAKKRGFQILNPIEKKNLAVSLLQKNMVIYGNAYDLVRCTKKNQFLR